MKQEFIEKIYAGWLAKIIGIRLGAPIEGWTYEKIRDIYGELDHYPVDYRDFAADDDSNGPLFFLRALEDANREQEGEYVLSARDVAEALLNYAPYEHGFFWWGGYGTSTEHTAYLNLRNGIPAPRSGSIEQNGAAVAEQIGGQIFIDTWGLAAPGNPDLAAKYAKEAASVTHDGNGIYGGIFIAVCISYAFVEQDIRKIIEKGLSYIPEDCEYTKVVRAVMRYHEEHPQDWRACFGYVHDNFGYDRYPGNCHIIPNSAVIILAMLYGEGDFERTLNICNMCGWDTDCNVGNVATIMGVRCGLEAIDYEKWRKPVNDFLACSGVVGSMNIMDIPYGALYIAKLACAAVGEELPQPWKTIAGERIDSCHFEYPGSTHAIRVRVNSPEGAHLFRKETTLYNTDETAGAGQRSLKVLVKGANTGEKIFVHKRTHYVPEDFHDSRYDPSFSPLAYPGQTLHGSAYIPEYGCEAGVSLYVKEVHGGCIYESEPLDLKKGQWSTLEWTIPAMKGGLLREVGVCFRITGTSQEPAEFVGMIDELYVDGVPSYSIEMEKEKQEVWPGLHREISQFTRLKGLLYLEDGQLHLSGADDAEGYTGHHSWSDYAAEFAVTPLTGEHHAVNFRVQGAIRSYAFALMPDDRAAILKNENGYRVLAEVPFAWKRGEEYLLKVQAEGDLIQAEVNGTYLEVRDADRPYLTGGIGLSVRGGSHMKCRRMRVGESV